MAALCVVLFAVLSIGAVAIFDKAEVVSADPLNEENYEFDPGFLRFSSGEGSKTVEVTITDLSLVDPTYAWSSGDTSIVTVSGSNNIVTVNPVANGSGLTEVTLTLSDGSTTIGTASFPVVVEYVWDGTGAAGNPYKISTAEDIDGIRTYIAIADADQNRTIRTYWQLQNNIDLTDFLNAKGGTYGWVPIGSYVLDEDENVMPIYTFNGVLLGNSNQITGLWIDLSDPAANPSTIHDVGLFGCTNDATIDGLGVIADAKGVSGYSDVGLIAAILIGASNITNCYGIGDTSSDSAPFTGVDDTYAVNVGGLVGNAESQSTISNSFFKGNVSAKGDAREKEYARVTVGGIAGWSEGTVTNCYAVGTVTGHGYSNTDTTYWNNDVTPVFAGGILGLLTGQQLSGCYAMVDVTVTSETPSDPSGGVSDGRGVIWETSVGGLIGYAGPTDPSGNNGPFIRNVYSTGTVNIISGSAGGLIGGTFYNTNISHAYTVSEASASSTAVIGGLVGKAFTTSNKIFENVILGTSSTHVLGASRDAGNYTSLDSENSILDEAGMIQWVNYENMNFLSSDWGIYEPYGYPYLKTIPNYVLIVPVTVTNIWYVHDVPYTTLPTYEYQGNLIPGVLPYSGNAGYQYVDEKSDPDTKYPMGEGTYYIVQTDMAGNSLVLKKDYYQAYFSTESYIEITSTRVDPTPPVINVRYSEGLVVGTLELPDGWLWTVASQSEVIPGVGTYTTYEVTHPGSAAFNPVASAYATVNVTEGSLPVVSTVTIPYANTALLSRSLSSLFSTDEAIWTWSDLSLQPPVYFTNGASTVFNAGTYLEISIYPVALKSGYENHNKDRSNTAGNHLL